MSAPANGTPAWPAWALWLVFTGLLLFAEFLHPRWILVWFALGAAAASTAAAMWPELLVVQIVVFLAASLGLTAAARPIVYHLFFKRHPSAVTNVAAIIGREETCIEDINNLEGRGVVRVYGTAWHAMSHRDEVTIKAGERVRIRGIRDLDLIVEPVLPAVRAEAMSGQADEAT